MSDSTDEIMELLKPDPWGAAHRADMAKRLEYLRGELRAERISTGELIELQGLAEYIDPGDVELLEAAGVPEFIVKVRADTLTPGQRIVFSEEFGGEGEVVTVAGTGHSFGTVAVNTEELDFELMFNASAMVEVKADQEQEDSND